jgi:cytochrome c oxidase subunit 2
MGRTKLLAIAAALAILPGAALAQQAAGNAAPAKAADTAPAPDAVRGPAPIATVADDRGTTAPSVAPKVTAEDARSEAATAVKPALDPDESLINTRGPADGLGSRSPNYDKAADAPTIAPTPDTPKIGQPNGDWRLQTHVTELGAYGHWFNDFLLTIMAVVTLIVFALLAYVMVRYRAKSNPTASRTSHNTLVEVLWTALPVLILVVIAVPSFRLLADQYDPPKPDLTIKTIGHQWYWEYEYPDFGAFTFDSIMLSDQEAARRGEPRLLAVDNRMIVPAGATVKMLVTAADVGHSWAVPAFWVKMDAWPGRINETWFKVDRPGVYYGPCSELCGTKHAFMPIAVEVVTPERFRQFIAAKMAENGTAMTPEINAALVDAVNGPAPAPKVAVAAAPTAAAAASTAQAAATQAGVSPAGPTAAAATAGATPTPQEQAATNTPAAPAAATK